MPFQTRGSLFPVRHSPSRSGPSVLLDRKIRSVRSRRPCMAHAFPAGQRRIVAPPAPPALHLIAAAGASGFPPPGPGFPLPVPLPPPVTTGYLVHPAPILFQTGGPAVVVTGTAVPALPLPSVQHAAAVPPPPSDATSAASPVGWGLGQAPLADVVEMRNHTLAQFMVAEGLVPSQDEELKRVAVIVQLKKIVLLWIKKVAWQHQLPNELIECASATVLPFGSYGLGVHGPESDIDALCVGPCYATLEEDFFTALRDMLQNRPEVSEVHCVKSAKVPLMRFKFNGISIDFPYAQLNAVSVPDNVDLLNPSLLKIDETSWRSLSGVRANIYILNLVPNLKDFKGMLRCLKLWAKRRGIYSHLLGFFGGIHLAILAAFVCRRFPNTGVSILISIFFDIFLHWPWPEPVILQDRPVHVSRPDGRSLMPIMMPCSPYDLCNSNITRSTFNKIKTEFLRGYSLTRDLKPDFEWCSLFEPFPYSKWYKHFIRIFLAAADVDELQDWLGWVKSRFRSLLVMLEDVQGYCDPNPTEYVDHDVAEPNTVFYWGLSLTGRNLVNVENLKHEFMKSVDKDNFGGYDGSHCKLELSIIEASQLPKNMQMNTNISKGPKVCWRILGHNSQGKPVYYQYLPQHFLGYLAADRG